MSYIDSVERPIVRQYLFRALIAVADLLEDLVCWSFKTPRPEIPHHDCLDWTDSELIENLKKSAPLEGVPNLLGATIYRLDSRTVFKIKGIDRGFSGAEREMLAWRYVWKHTSIPTPRYYCARENSVGAAYIIMEYIEGETLEDAWPKLSRWARLRVVWTIHSYIRQLRRAPVPPDAFPGPLGPRPRLCSGSLPNLLKDWPNDCYKCGPFTSAQEFHDKATYYAAKRASEKPDTQRGPFPAMKEPVPLVFTHNDLNMGNILLGKDGLVYLIDWDFSGFYPVYAEYIGIEHDVWLNGGLRPWRDWGWWAAFVAGPYFNYYRWILGRVP